MSVFDNTRFWGMTTPDNHGMRCRVVTMSTGRPCRKWVRDIFLGACETHATAKDHIRADLTRECVKDLLVTAISEYDRKLEAIAKERREESERAVKADRERAIARSLYRTHTNRGTQLVMVNNSYTYEWSGEEPLQVGDRVLLPGSWVSPEGWDGVVTSLGSSYRGETKSIRSLVQKWSQS